MFGRCLFCMYPKQCKDYARKLMVKEIKNALWQADGTRLGKNDLRLLKKVAGKMMIQPPKV